MSIGIVSTFSEAGYRKYGKNFFNSMFKFVSGDIKVFLYLDNTNIDISSSRTTLYNLEKTNPDLTAFKNRHKDYKPKDFKSDAVRFAHKSYAIYHAAKNSNVDLLIWLDADTEIYDSITETYLKSFLPEGYFTSYLGRPDYSETGFISFDLTNKYSTEYFEKFINYYSEDTIFKLPGQLDCHVYDDARVQLENENKIKGYNLTPPNLEKNHFNTVFEGYMLHYKGDRKDKKEKMLQKALTRKNK